MSYEFTTMPIFNYKARDKLGKLMEAGIEAADESAVIRNLRQSGYTVISIEQQSEVQLKLDQFSRKFRRISKIDVLFFVRQLAT